MSPVAERLNRTFDVLAQSEQVVSGVVGWGRRRGSRAGKEEDHDPRPRLTAASRRKICSYDLTTAERERDIHEITGKFEFPIHKKTCLLLIERMAINPQEHCCQHL